jgi:hypothetical protein
MERAASTGKEKTPYRQVESSGHIKILKEKGTNKAPESLPRRLRHFTGPQPGVSRL